MSDIEQEIRRMLRGILDPIAPAPSLRRNTVRRAKVRRAFSTAIAGSMVVLVIGGASWGAIAIRQGTLEDSPRGVGSSPTPDEAAAPRLYLAGDGELWMVDLTERVRHVELSELSPGDPPYRIVRRGERLAAWGYKTYLLDPALESPPQVLVHDSLIFIPSAHEDRVWVGIPDSDSREGRLDAVREVTIDGEVTVPDVRPPDGNWPERSLDDGLVFSREGRMIVWDPLSDTVVFRFDADNLGPTHNNLIAWCDAYCESIHITDVATGSDTTVQPPPGFVAFDVWAGDFAPDGKTLAVPVRRDVRDVDEEADSELQLSLIDVTSATARAVDGSNVREGYNFVGWTSSGEYVFFTGGQKSEDRSIIAYRVGDESVRLQVNVGDFFGAAAM